MGGDRDGNFNVICKVSLYDSCSGILYYFYKGNDWVGVV